MSQIPSELLVAATHRLERVNFFDCKLTTEQLHKLLSELAGGKCSKLKHLNLSVNDMSQIPSELLVAHTQRLERVNFRGCELTTEQLRSLLSELAEGNCSKLKHLNLNLNNMSQIPSELLVVATQRLEIVNFRGCKLTTEQVTALYQMVAERRSGSLKTLVISRNDVPPSLIERAKLNKSVSLL